jgi:nitric oxide reductase NorF protein
MNKTRQNTVNPQRALFYLMILTLGIFAVSALLPNTSAKPAATVTVATLAFLKVRLVALDFLGLRLNRSRTRPALIAWAAAVLLIALMKVFVSSAVFAN